MHNTNSSDSFTNLEFKSLHIFFMNICYDFFFNWQTEEKKLFCTNLFSSFSIVQTKKKSCKKLGRQGSKLVKTSDEFVNAMVCFQKRTLLWSYWYVPHHLPYMSHKGLNRLPKMEPRCKEFKYCLINILEDNIKFKTDVLW